jgi:7-cyano-7-deazaguanine synthase
MAKAYVLLSGGVDSSTCVGHAMKLFGSVVAIGVFYGQRHVKELEHAKEVADAMGARFLLKDIRGAIGRGGLTDPKLEIPKVSYDDLPYGVSPTYVPFRNGVLLSVLTSSAAADPEAAAVYYGAHAEDAANYAYPDCTPEFIAAMDKAIEIGTYGKIQLYTPLVNMTKAEVVELGQSVGVPWEKTWSCYEGGKVHCGVCPTCRARRAAFQKAGVVDPTQYAQEAA